MWIAGLAMCATACAEEPTAREQLEDRLSSAKSACAYQTVEYNKETVPQYEAEWDMAAAENIDSISPKGEWEIRKMLGREMGLHPSEVNGWREIYRKRAESARRQQESVSRHIEEARKRKDEACDYKDQLKSQLNAIPIR